MGTRPTVRARLYLSTPNRLRSLSVVCRIRNSYPAPGGTLGLETQKEILFFLLMDTAPFQIEISFALPPNCLSEPGRIVSAGRNRCFQRATPNSNVFLRMFAQRDWGTGWTRLSIIRAMRDPWIHPARVRCIEKQYLKRSDITMRALMRVKTLSLIRGC